MGRTVLISAPHPRKRSSRLRLLGALAILLALAAGAAWSTARSGAAPSPGAPAVAGNAAVGQVLIDAEPVEGTRSDDPYQLDRLPIFSGVINHVARNYVEPKRIDPRAMLYAALDQVERTVAEVMVEGEPSSGRVKVTVGEASREFEVPTFETIYGMRRVLGDIMGFIQRHLVARHNLREIEYAAVNGMLSTLDPHSMLLEPRVYREMTVQTRGVFGGLGFVIAMRDGNLTVVRVLRNTPAQRAGIRAKDVISRIEEQSTINMDLQDAVDRLRGKPHTRINITVARTGWAEPKRISLVREIINIESVPQAKLLEGGVGYVKLATFAANASKDLSAAIQQQRTQAGGNLRGLVLDLRGNGGGLLEQAIQIGDLFLSDGVIVKTVGGGDGRRVNEVKEAHADPADLTGLPLVVLVNNASASASEIVAGALRGNNRALVLGRQTFGKGSVQVLYDFSDPSRPGEDTALKLTIAQYLTPGDVSIQEVGITPDVLLLPGRALKDAVNAFAPPRVMGEASLDRHFTNPARPDDPGKPAAERAAAEHPREKSPLELRYLLDEKEDQVAKALKAEQRREEARKHVVHDGDPEITPEQQEDDEAEAGTDELVEDYQIRFAKEVLQRFPFPDRARQIDGAKILVAERKKEEEARLRTRLEQLGLDWSGGPASGTPRALVTVSPPPGRRLSAGETVSWTVTVENRGDGPFERLRAWSLVDKNPLLDRREFVFGRVKPGERRSWSVPVKLPGSLDSRRDQIALHFEEENGRAPPDFSTTLDVVEQPRPLFAFSAQADDDAGGNGDGLVQRGEEVALRIDVKNEGAGPSGDKTWVSIKSLGDDKVFIKTGRAVLGTLKPGEVKTAALHVEVRRGLKPDKVPLRVTVIDEKSGEAVSEKLELPVVAEGLARAGAEGGVRITADEAVLRSGASASATPIATARRGAILPVSARYGGFVKVEWRKGRSAFAAASDVQPAGRGRREGAAAEIWQRQPPRIALSPDPTRGAPIVDTDRLRVEGSAVVPATVAGAGTQLRDVFIYVNDQKVFFKVVPEKAAARRMDFAADVPLKPGNNVVTVFAREDEDFQAHRTFVVYRRSPAEIAQGMPKN